MRKQPIDFRKEEVSYVTRQWASAASCSLVGVGSVGKSNLLQHLTSPDVITHYLTLSHEIATIIVDANMLAATTEDDAFNCWAGYELMFNRLYMTLYPFNQLGDNASLFYSTYQAMQNGNNPLYKYMGLRYLELGLNFFFQQDVQVVFMFDEFEELLSKMPVRFFQTLRGLRDSHKSKLSYLTFTREPLSRLVERYHLDSLAMEPFIELFNDHQYFVGPYNARDAHAMMQSLLRSDQKTNAGLSGEIAILTGGFAGLLRSVCNHINTLAGTPSLTDVSHFLTIASIRKECLTIWKALDHDEQMLLRATASNQLPTAIIPQETVDLLVQKRLLSIDLNSAEIVIRPALLAQYVRDLDTRDPS